jgi:hypothetical protein
MSPAPSRTDTSAPSMHPDEARWEALLDPTLRNEPAFQYVKDLEGLPRALLIGDSISIGYTAPVRKALAGKVNIHRIPENGGDTWRGLAKLNMWLSTGRWEVIHFNFGLHDLKHMQDNRLDLAGEQVSSLDAYESNLDKLAIELKKTGAMLVWASTTPVPEGAAGRLKGDDVIYNAAALKVMQRHQIRVNDLYAHMLPMLEMYQRPRDVHYTAEGYTFLGQKVAAEIRHILTRT